MASEAIDSLYEVVPAEFVKARNALVKSLKAAGQPDEAARAAQLSRPTASVWATNQVARRAPRLIADLAGVTERLQTRSASDRERYAAAINDHRQLLNQVRERVESVLVDGGLRVAPQTVAAAVQNFRTGLTDNGARRLLQQGRLAHDVGLDQGAALFGGAPPVGADHLGEMAWQSLSGEAAPGPRAAPSGEPGATAQDERRATTEIKQGERERRQRERTLAKARAHAERLVNLLRKAAAARIATREQREAAAASARRQLETAERELAAAQVAERQAADALAAAELELQTLHFPADR